MSEQSRTITLIGSGIMGTGMAINLLKKNHSVRLFTRKKKSWDQFSQEQKDLLNSTFCSQHLNLKDALEGSELVILCLTEDEVVEELFFAEDFLKASPKWIVDTGTTSPELTLKMWNSCKDRKILFLDSPMTGSKLAAESGQILFMVGGDPTQIQELKYFFDTCGKKTIHCGAVSSGQRAKIALNMIQAGLFQVYTEGFLLAEKDGIDSNTFMEIMENSAGASPLLSFKMRSVLNQDYSAHFALKNMNKDLNHAMRRARELKVVLPVATQLKPIYEAGLLAGFGEEDFCSLAKVNRLWNTKSFYKTEIS